VAVLGGESGSLFIKLGLELLLLIMVLVVTLELFLFFLQLSLGNLLLSLLDFLHQEAEWHLQLLDEDAHLFEHLHIVLNLLIPLLDGNLSLEHLILFFWHAWRALLTESSLGLHEIFLGCGKLSVAVHNLTFEFCLSFKQLIHRVCILSGKFSDVDHAISILITFGEKFLNNLTTVLLIDTLFGQELGHLFLVDFAVTVKVDGTEL